MEEQLKLILNIRDEINELIKLRDEQEEKYNNIETSIDDTFNSIQNMNKKLEKLKEQFENAKNNKIFKFSIPSGIGAAIITFIIFAIYGDFPDGLFNIILSGVCSFVSGTAVSCVPVMILNMFDSFFIKRYSDIKQLNDKINNLNNSIMLSERNFEKMKVDRDSLYTTLKFKEEQLEMKREELYRVEEEYFNSLVGKTFITEDGKNYTVSIAPRSKTKVRIPSISKNLDN